MTRYYPVEQPKIDKDCEYSDELHQVIERIVRCKDCKFFGKGEACVMFPMQTIRMIHPSKNGFCAWGERIDD